MHILLTNDDGYRAVGIRMLARKLSAFARVTVYAPLEQKSTCSSSMTLRTCIRVRKIKREIEDVPVFAVDGTTADCCKIALCSALKDDMPDMIVSGMNYGYNVGSDFLYSGTVAGALESIFFNIPAMAVSLDKNADAAIREKACGFAAEAVQKIFIDKGFRGILNMNIPTMETISWDKVRVSKLGIQQYDDPITASLDPEGNSIYWIGGKMKSEAAEDEDVSLVPRGFITMTPLTWNATDEKSVAPLKQIIHEID